ncbi:aldehyde ferredoxin oxidoreductase C-terminal domain-containing protein [Alkaliphilus serpentinus]|nr:aldehyde ferredoxin oxidoreductase C-terminal domain-containing protein [Alkaliphilus serpentinus]
MDPEIMYIDLEKGTHKIDRRGDLSSYLGGVALATELLKENCLIEEDPLVNNQPVIFTKGPLNTIFPVVTKVCSMFTSPLTGELGESYGGMRLAMAMALAGLDGIVIKGRRGAPCILHIDDKGVRFLDAKSLWGLDTDETTRLLHDQEGKRGLRSIMVIGDGGEKGVKFANVTIDSYRHFGRLGLGCLLGSKNIKAIIVEGARGREVDNLKEYKRVYKEIAKRVIDTDVMEKYHGIGTSINIKALNEMGGLPTFNFQKSQFNRCSRITGEYFAKKHLIKKLACSGCPIGCIHIAIRRKKFGEPHEYHSTAVAYDHELIYSLGSMLGIARGEEVLELIEAVEKKGLDAITSGVLMAWITEAYQRGLLDAKMLLTTPAFGKKEGYLKIIENIVIQPNEFYKRAAEGTHSLTSHYGGQDYGMVLAKNEVAGYHTGYGNLLGQAVGARHSHLDNGGYSIDQEINSLDSKEIVKKLIQEEIERNLLNSLVICLFARKVYDFDTIKNALNSIGIKISKEELHEIGLRTFLEKMILKERMGFSYKDITFPKRFFETEALFKALDEENAYEILNEYIEEIHRIKLSRISPLD